MCKANYHLKNHADQNNRCLENLGKFSGNLIFSEITIIIILIIIKIIIILIIIIIIIIILIIIIIILIIISSISTKVTLHLLIY